MADDVTGDVIRWLHPNDGPVALSFEADGSMWTVTIHWADVDGTATAVGLDLRSFNREGPLPTGLRPVTTELLRRLRLAELIDASRQWNSLGNRRDGWRRTDDGAAKDRAAALTDKPRKAGRPADPGRGDDFIAEVASIYWEARGHGGTPARQPWLYVAEELAARGVEQVTPGQLKNWRRRAKNLGLLESPKGEEK